MKKRIVLTSAVLLSLTVAGMAFAQVPVNATTKEKSKKAEVKINKCEVVEARIENQINKFEENKEKHTTSYNKIKEKLQKFIKRLDDKGYDTAKLKEDLITFDAKLKKFANDYATYITLLKETEDYTCKKSAGEFKAKLQTAREQLKVVHEDAVEIRTFFAKTFRRDILELKNQQPKTDSDTQTDTDQTSTESEE